MNSLQWSAEYSVAEAMEILRLASAVSGTLSEEPIPTKKKQDLEQEYDRNYLFPHAPADMPPVKPFVNDDRYPGSALPSLQVKRWPDGWVAGVKGGDWSRSICHSAEFMNQAMLSYCPRLDAYCLAFRGTDNFNNALEDALAILSPLDGEPVPGELLRKLLDRDPRFKEVVAIAKEQRLHSRELPGVTERAAVHLGFRLALASLNSSLAGGHRLSSMLAQVADQAQKKPIRIYVTGISLGAGMAALAAAWLNTQPISDACFEVKCYSFAQPKPGNEYFAYQQAVEFGNQRVFCVNSTLDTVPQVPLSLESPKSLNYPESLGKIGISAKLVDSVEKALGGVLAAANYCHMGQVVVLAAKRVVEECQIPDENKEWKTEGIYCLLPNGELAGKYVKGKVHYLPAYLMLTPEQVVGEVPPPGQWNPVKPYCYVDQSGVEQLMPQDNHRVSAIAALWQHMPWMYQQWLYLQTIEK